MEQDDEPAVGIDIHHDRVVVADRPVDFGDRARTAGSSCVAR
jgi:hypothetical protein